MLPCGVAYVITIFVLFKSARKSEYDVHSIPYTVSWITVDSQLFVLCVVGFDVCLSLTEK